MLGGGRQGYCVDWEEERRGDGGAPQAFVSHLEAIF